MKCLEVVKFILITYVFFDTTLLTKYIFENLS